MPEIERQLDKVNFLDGDGNLSNKELAVMKEDINVNTTIPHGNKIQAVELMEIFNKVNSAIDSLNQHITILNNIKPLITSNNVKNVSNTLVPIHSIEGITTDETLVTEEYVKKLVQKWKVINPLTYVFNPEDIGKMMRGTTEESNRICFGIIVTSPTQGEYSIKLESRSNDYAMDWFIWNSDKHNKNYWDLFQAKRSGNNYIKNWSIIKTFQIADGFEVL